MDHSAVVYDYFECQLFAGDDFVWLRRPSCNRGVMLGSELVDVECGEDGCQTEGPENRECFPIFVSPNDPVFGGRKRCLMFVRSQEVPNENCDPGFRYRFLFVSY